MIEIYEVDESLTVNHFVDTYEVGITNCDTGEEELLGQDFEQTEKIILILQKITGKDLEFLKEMKQNLESNDILKRHDVIDMLGDWIDQIEEVKPLEV